MKIQLLLVLSVASLVAGCQTQPKPKASLTRGWIGGEYCSAKRGCVPRGAHSRVYVKQIYPHTPAEEGGLTPGDLITAINGRAVADLKQFHQLVDGTKPGSTAVISVVREGKPLDLSLTTGRETYQQWHAVTFGLGFSTQLDFWPNPDFSLLPVAQYKRPVERVEVRAPEQVLASQAKRSNGNGEVGTHSDEGWSFWFVLFGLNANKRILSQEFALPPAALASPASASTVVANSR